MIGRLVEQQQIGAAHQRLREIEAHPPAAGEAPDRILVARLDEAQAGEQRRGARPGAIAADDFETVMEIGQRFAAVVGVAIGGGERVLDGAQLAIAVEHVVERAGRDGRGFLRDVRDRPRRRQVDRACIGNQFVANRREQARLAAPVGADEPELVPGVHVRFAALRGRAGAEPGD